MHRRLLHYRPPLGTTLVTEWHDDRDHGTAHLLGDASAAEPTIFVTMLDRTLGNLGAAQ
jgi:hypothetical protein